MTPNRPWRVDLVMDGDDRGDQGPQGFQGPSPDRQDRRHRHRRPRRATLRLAQSAPGAGHGHRPDPPERQFGGHVVAAARTRRPRGTPAARRSPFSVGLLMLVVAPRDLSPAVRRVAGPGPASGADSPARSRRIRDWLGCRPPPLARSRRLTSLERRVRRKRTTAQYTGPISYFFRRGIDGRLTNVVDSQASPFGRSTSLAIVPSSPVGYDGRGAAGPGPRTTPDRFMKRVIPCRSPEDGAASR